MERTRLKVASSKWLKWQLIHSCKDLAHIQPRTAIYSPDTLMKFLDQYKNVFIKPDKGWGGDYVIKVKKHNSIISALHNGKLLKFSGIRAFHQWYKSIHKGHLFIIQQGIELLPLNGRSVDLRLQAQRNEEGNWEISAMFAKIAKKGMAVTNVKAGGKAIHIKEYYRLLGLNQSEQEQLTKRLMAFTFKIVQFLDQHFTNSVYGIDIGIDRSGRLWLIEINTKPYFGILKKIDSYMYRRTMELDKLAREAMQ